MSLTRPRLSGAIPNTSSPLYFLSPLSHHLSPIKDDKEVARKGYGAASEQTRSQILFILFVVAFCIYLIPRIASIFSITLTTKSTAPIPGQPNSRIHR